MSSWLELVVEQAPSANSRVAAVAAIEAEFAQGAEIDRLDGLSAAFADWRFNLRQSNTEPVVRLNVETRGDAELLAEKTAAISARLKAFG